MDREAELRHRLILELQDSFYCWEEVSVRHLFYKDIRLRIDVIAIPRESEFQKATFAFEVKNPKNPDDTSYWKKAIKQASDYTYTITEKKLEINQQLENRIIDLTFLYYGDEKSFGINEKSIKSYFDLATYFKVGRATYRPNEKSGMSLHLGGTVWRTDKGFTSAAKGIVFGKKLIGGTRLANREFYLW